VNNISYPKAAHYVKHCNLPLLPSCRNRTPAYVSLYCLSVGFKHHRMSPFTVSFSGSNTTVCPHYCLPVGLKHRRMSPITLSLGFKHLCMSPTTVSLSGSNTTVCLPLLSVCRVSTPLYVSHHCLSLYVSSTSVCLPLLFLSL
jgi:hypothetical protein